MARYNSLESHIKDLKILSGQVWSDTSSNSPTYLSHPANAQHLLFMNTSVPLRQRHQLIAASVDTSVVGSGQISHKDLVRTRKKHGILQRELGARVQAHRAHTPGHLAL
jgi:hypothetical protein